MIHNNPSTVERMLCGVLVTLRKCISLQFKHGSISCQDHPNAPTNLWKALLQDDVEDSHPKATSHLQIPKADLARDEETNEGT